MKLSKKVAVIFLTTTLSTILMFIISSNLMIEYFYTGENSRIAGRTNGSLNRINSEVSKIYGKSKEYANLVNAARVFENRDGIKDARKILGFEYKFKKDDIDLKLILDRDLAIDEVFDSSEKQDYTEERLNAILEIVNKEIKSMNIEKDDTHGMLSVEDDIYIFAAEPIKERKGNTITGYFVTIDLLGEETLKLVGSSMDNTITIENYLDKASVEDSIEITNSGKIIDIVYGDDVVYSYYKLDLANSDDVKYIRVEEQMVVRQNTTRNIMIFTVIIAASSIMVNILLYGIIEKLVVKRIVILNEGINKIKESKNLKERITPDNKGDEIGILTKDINEMFDSLEEADRNLEIKEKKYANVLNTMSNGFAYFKEIKDENNNFIDAEIVDFNNTFLKLVSKTAETLKNKKLSDFKENDNNKISILKNSLHNLETKTIQIEEKLPNGNWVSASMYRIEPGYFAIILNDITKIKEYSEEMSYLASYDILTSLLNRYNLYNYMDDLKSKGKHFTVFFIDLDNFKNLNDTLGHNTGDEILCLAAKELTGLADDKMVVGRLGGDEFIIIKEEDMEDSDVISLGNSILKTLNRTINFNNYTFELRASIGASLYPHHAEDVETLLQYADIAMYEVKNNGGNDIKVFSQYMQENLILEGKLVNSIKNNELEVYYQPILDIENDKVTSAEALVRWNLDGEVIPPDKFISISKKNGFIAQLDHFVLTESCRFCKRIREEGESDFKISVNMSYLYLKQPKFKEVIEGILKEVDLEPSALKLEITEDEILDDMKYVMKVLEEVKELGVMVSLDDFGVGYSSFNHVKMLPIDTLKIDRSILIMAEEDTKTMAIIETLITFAHTLGLDVVCEGVEVQEQFNFLKELRCDKIQGYLISRPIRETEFFKLMNK